MQFGKVRGSGLATCAILLSVASAGAALAIKESHHPVRKVALSTTASVRTRTLPAVSPADSGPRQAAKPNPLILLRGFTEKSVTVNGVERHYYLQTPPQVHGPGPMIIALHGVNSSPNWIANETAWQARLVARVCRW